jgi:hypothetical protein
MPRRVFLAVAICGMGAVLGSSGAACSSPDAEAARPTAPNSDDAATMDGGVTPEEIDSTLGGGGLPPAKAGGPMRPLAVLSCETVSNLTAAATHLVEDLRSDPRRGAPGSARSGLLPDNSSGVPENARGP